MANPQVITAWFNAFIPGDIPWLSRTVPDGRHEGETMIPGPTALNDCFLTDQRSFDSDTTASCRLHSHMKLIVDGQALALEQTHRCDRTVEVDCEDGDVECEQSANTAHMQFTLDSATITDGKATIHLNSQAGNPCFTGAPSIKYIGILEVDFTNQKVTFTGSVQEFPSYEGYLRFDEGEIETLYQIAPEENSSPWNLTPGPSRAVNGTADFP